MNTPPTGGGTPPDQGGQSDPQGPPPPPPPHQPPSAQQSTAPSRPHQSLDQAQAAARNPGSGGTPSGSQQATPRPSGGDQEDNNPNHHGRSSGMKAGTAILIVGILALIVFFGLGWKSCTTVDKLVERTAPGAVTGAAPGSSQPGSTDPAAPPGTPGSPGSGGVPATSNKVAPNTPSPTITSSEANLTRECNSTIVGKGSGRWYMVGTPTDSHVTLAARFCVGGNGTFRAAESARIVGRMAYIREGGHEASGNVDTKYKLSDLAPGKAYADISQTVNGTEKSYRLENPYMVFIDEGNAFDFCEQYKYKQKPPKDDLVALEIWSRCQAGGQQNAAVAQSIAQNPSWFSREDGASLSAKVQQLEQKVAANGGQPVKLPPKEVDFNAAGPSK